MRRQGLNAPYLSIRTKLNKDAQTFGYHKTVKRRRNPAYCLCAVRCSASHKLKQNEQNIDMCITANSSFYSILFDLEE